MAAVPPEGADVPTVRLIRRMLWDQISIIPSNAPDSELPTYGQLRKAIEKRIGKQFDKNWRPWIRDTVDIMMDRCSAGLDFA